MKLFILSEDLSDSGPIWVNILWPMLRVFSECFDVTLLQIPRAEKLRDLPPLVRLLKWRDTRSHRQAWAAQVRGDLDAEGPNLLMVWGSSPTVLEWCRVLDPLWDLFSHRILHIIDAMQPEHVSESTLTRFDLMTCFCSDLADAYAARVSRPTLFFPAHVDTLNFYNQGQYRPIDLLLVGRRDNRYHLPLYTHFNSPERNRIFVDLQTRGQTPLSREQEFRLLMSAHGKAVASFCYEPSCVPRFRGRSPLLDRWVHSWTSGCTVFGTRPRGSGTARLMDWPDSMIDLPADIKEAVDVVEGTLSDRKSTAIRRHRNVLEAVRRHDTRFRIDAMLKKLGLASPANLVGALDQLSELERWLGKSAQG